VIAAASPEVARATRGVRDEALGRLPYAAGADVRFLGDDRLVRGAGAGAVQAAGRAHFHPWGLIPCVAACVDRRAVSPAREAIHGHDAAQITVLMGSLMPRAHEPWRVLAKAAPDH
jgi:hypothetical protein